jgi:cytochrome c oxidase subunit 2
MRLILAIFVGLLPMLNNSANAAGDADAGQALYTTCAVCHGADGAGSATMRAAPRINHLGTVYMVAQLQKFKTGIRGGEGDSKVATQMAAMALPLADEQAMQDVAAYIATLDGTISPASVEGDLDAGGNHFKQFCGACHGMTAEGNPMMNSPRLAGTDDWYLLTQLQSFRTGTRGTNPADVTGMQMRGMAGALPDEQALSDVTAYIRSLGE